MVDVGREGGQKNQINEFCCVTWLPQGEDVIERTLNERIYLRLY